MHRPVNVALLRVYRLRFRERDDQVAAPQRAVIDLPPRRIEVAAFHQLDVAADDGNNVLPVFQPGTIDNRNVRIGHAENDINGSGRFNWLDRNACQLVYLRQVSLVNGLRSRKIKVVIKIDS